MRPVHKVMIGMVALLGMAGLAAAQATDAGAGSDVVAAAGISWMEVLRNGGYLMYVLAALSFLTITFVIYFFVVLRVPQVAPAALRDELVQKIGSGNIDDAQRACEYRACPLSSVALAGLDYVNHVADVNPMLLKDVMEGEGQRQAESIQGQTQYLMDISAVAPMVGLLGTVFGMLRAFSSVALDLASAKPVNLAAGVSQALITTAFGLMVSIPAMMFYAYFRRRAGKLVARLEVASTHVLASLMAGGSGPSAPLA